MTLFGNTFSHRWYQYLTGNILLGFFNPLTDENSFCKYGVALLQVDLPEEKVKKNQMDELDVHNGRYIEYIVDKVPTEYITGIYIPRIFKERINLPTKIMSKIIWCEMKANYFRDNDKEDCTNKLLEQFAKTAEIVDSSECNFFRGLTEKRTMIDLYDIQYIF